MIATATTTFLLSWAMAAAFSAQPVKVAGAPQDAFASADGSAIFVTSTRGGKRRVERIFPTPSPPLTAPREAVFVSACAGSGNDALVWTDGRGVVRTDGQRALSTPSLFSLPDPGRLFVNDACQKDGTLRVATKSGIAVVAPGVTADKTLTLQMRHKAKAYSGRHHKGLAAPSRYAVATSTYAPLMVDADVDGDGRQDLLVMLQERVIVYRREKSGMLNPKPSASFAVTGRIPEVAGAELRVIVGDLSGSGRTDLIVQGQKSRLPESSQIYRLESAPGRFDFKNRSTVLSADGFVAPLAILPRSPPRLLTADADTSLVALGALVVSGSADVELTVRDVNGKRTQRGPTVSAEVDIRRGAMAGTAPVADVDLDRDGLTDVLDFSDAGSVRFFRGMTHGVSKNATADVSVKRPAYVVPLPAAHAVVLIPASGRQVTLLTATADAAPRWRRRR